VAKVVESEHSGSLSKKSGEWPKGTLKRAPFGFQLTESMKICAESTTLW